MSPLADRHLWLSDIRGLCTGSTTAAFSIVRRFVGGDEPAGLGSLQNGDLLVAGMARCLIYRVFDWRAAAHANLTQRAPQQINDKIRWFRAMLVEAVIACDRKTRRHSQSISIGPAWVPSGLGARCIRPARGRAPRPSAKYPKLHTVSHPPRRYQGRQ
jgi:hypothetical protein